jgi:hypothetical protein
MRELPGSRERAFLKFLRAFSLSPIIARASA